MSVDNALRYRESHEVPAGVKAAFDEAANYFPTPIQLFQFFDKYSRYDHGKKRRETWVETVDRAVRWLKKLSRSKLDDSVYEEISQYILEMKAMPSMRLLSMAGPYADDNNTAIYNCLARETQFITDEGVRSFEDYNDGDSVTVLTHTGSWKEAKVRCYGQQVLRTVTLKRGRTEKTVRATSSHRWLLRDGVETVDLKCGDILRGSPTPFTEWSYWEAEPDERLFWAYGFVYGDGTCVRSGDGVPTASMVRLCGDKAKYLNRFTELGFKCSFPPSLQGEPMVYTGKYLKALPNLPTDGVRLVRAFVAGWLDADGAKDPNNGSYKGIQASGAEAIAFIRETFPAVGAYILNERDLTGQETNYGVRPETMSFSLMIQQGTRGPSHYSVTDIDGGVVEDVWCLEVEDDHSFVLPSGIVTGNCSYLPVCDTRTFAEALYISMSGCGVGFSVESANVYQLPVVHKQRHAGLIRWTVPDSAEGWAYTLQFCLDSWFDGYDVELDWSEVRPAGVPLKRKGGRASGPEPFQKCLDFARKTILGAQVRQLTTLEAHDIMCWVGQAAVSGGVRRTAMISLFDYDDQLMLHCKDGNFSEENPQRWNANNSAVWPDDITDDDIDAQMDAMFSGGNGEPGIFNRRAANDLSPFHRRSLRNFEDQPFGTNPCGEISLRPYEFCNLSIAVARYSDTIATLMSKVRIATIIGTIQSMATDFPDILRPEWKQNCDEERLLGVDITGQRDCPLLNGPGGGEIRQLLRVVAESTNMEFADKLGIPGSASITCVKPSGNSSQLLNCSSGLHARWAPYYERNVRVSAHGAVYKVLRDAGVPMSPENGQEEGTADTYVVHFPVASPEGAITRNDVSAIEQCEYWLNNKVNWTTHNPSVTITYRPHEMEELKAWVVEHRNLIGGMAFLPAFDANYAQLPYIEISKEEYERRIAEFPPVDFSRLWKYEAEDETEAAQNVACFGTTCEIDNV